MPFLFLGLALLVLLILGGWVFTKADPQALARRLRASRQLGGLALLAVAGFLTLRGAWQDALPIGLFGLSLLRFGWGRPKDDRAREPSPGRRSSVRTLWLDMALDHDSGAVEGRVRRGRFAGATLAELGPEALATLYAELAGDPDSVRLLEAYLDRRQPGWREDLKRDAAAGPGGAARSRALTEEEAYEVLGLRPGAGAAEIRQAHRALMKRVHPDQGGSTYLAARLNEAKDLLLRKHRRDP